MPRNEGEERRTRRNEEIEFRVYVNKYNKYKNRKKEINNDGLIVERGKGKRQYKNKWHSGQCNNAERAMQCREGNAMECNAGRAARRRSIISSIHIYNIKIPLRIFIKYINSRSNKCIIYK